MADPSDDGDGVDADVPDAVLDWLSSMAAERGMSETELLRTLLAGGGGSIGGGGGGGVDEDDLEEVEREFRELVEDVRERIVQVKRETDEKAAADHTHHDLQNTLEQLGRQIGTLEAEIDRLEDQLTAGFENYEEILTYLTDTTDALDRKFTRLARVVIDLREQVGDASRDEARRTALAHLTNTANRHGIEKAKCASCGEGVNVGMLVEPRCPHCDSTFSALEPKSGFFRNSMLHTGTMPALEAGPDEIEAEAEALEAMVEEEPAGAEAAPSFGMEDVEAEPTEPVAEAEPETEPQEEAPAEGAGEAESAAEPQEETPAEPPAEAESTAEPQPETHSEPVGGTETTPEPQQETPAETAGESESAPEAEQEAAAEGPDAAEPEPADEPAEAAAGSTEDEAEASAMASRAGGPASDGQDRLQRIDGVGPAYADRLVDAGIDDLLALAVADPEVLGEAIDVPPTTVADWVEQADAMTGT